MAKVTFASNTASTLTENESKQLDQLTMQNQYHEKDRQENLTIRNLKTSSTCSAAKKAMPRWAKVCEEIQETEQRYADYLHVLVDHFIPAIASFQHENATSRQIFGNVEQLLAFSAEFQRALKEALEAGKVGALYLRIAPYYRLYSDYCSNHAEAVKLVCGLSRDNASFRSKVRSCEQAYGNGQTLLSLMIMPIQRVPRHILLLEQLCKALPPEDPDLLACRDALCQMQEVGQQINESIRKKENAVKVWEVQNSLLLYDIHDDDLEPEQSPIAQDGKLSLFETNRVFVREGELFKVCNRKFKKRRKFFLFNDCLIYARPVSAMGLRGKKKWQFRSLLQVVRVEDLPDSSSLSLGAANAFSIIATSRRVVCIAETPEDKKAWLVALRANLVHLCTRIRQDSGASSRAPSPERLISDTTAGDCTTQHTSSSDDEGSLVFHDVTDDEDTEDDEETDIEEEEAILARIEDTLDSYEPFIKASHSTIASQAMTWEEYAKQSRTRIMNILQSLESIKYLMSFAGYARVFAVTARTLLGYINSEIQQTKISAHAKLIWFAQCYEMAKISPPTSILQHLGVWTQSVLLWQLQSMKDQAVMLWSSRFALAYSSRVMMAISWAHMQGLKEHLGNVETDMWHNRIKETWGLVHHHIQRWKTEFFPKRTDGLDKEDPVEAQ